MVEAWQEAKGGFAKTNSSTILAERGAKKRQRKAANRRHFTGE
jgi:hypothetical protein